MAVGAPHRPQRRCGLRLAPGCPARGRGGGPAIFVRSKFSGMRARCGSMDIFVFLFLSQSSISVSRSLRAARRGAPRRRRPRPGAPCGARRCPPPPRRPLAAASRAPRSRIKISTLETHARLKMAHGHARHNPSQELSVSPRQPFAFLRFADGGASGGDGLGKQVPPGEAALISRPCTSLSLGHSARVRAGSSTTLITPWPRKKHGEKCWRRLRWRRRQRGLGSPTITKRPSIAPACAAPRLLPLRAPTAGAWLGVRLGLGLGLG